MGERPANGSDAGARGLALSSEALPPSLNAVPAEDGSLARLPEGQGGRVLVSPKSTSFTTMSTAESAPLSAMRRFCGLMSRCTMSRECRYSSAPATWAKMLDASASVKPSCGRRTHSKYVVLAGVSSARCGVRTWTSATATNCDQQRPA